MFRTAYRSSSGALTLFAVSGLHTHVVIDRSQVWVGTEFPLRLDYCWLPHAFVNQRLQIQLELLMMIGMLLETCWASNERWNNKFYYKVAACWLFLLSHTAMHGSMNIKFKTQHSFFQLNMWCHYLPVPGHGARQWQACVGHWLCGLDPAPVSCVSIFRSVFHIKVARKS
jgi:hypothetical protein